MPQTVEQLAADYKWSREALLSQRVKNIATNRAYYHNDQNLTFATAKFRDAFAQLFTEFSYNRCASVIDATTDRLHLQGFTTAGLSPGQNDANADILRNIWRKNRMDKKQGDFAREALLAGDVYWIVWPELFPSGEILPAFYVNTAETTVVRYDDDTKRKRVACKMWQDEVGRWRTNLFYADNIYKYTTADKKDAPPKDFATLIQWIPDPELVAAGILTAEPWPIPNPFLEIPVFHYPNRAKDGEFGRSELLDVIPLQDALNKACTDLMVAMEFGAFPQRWATGLELGIPDPITGKIKSPFEQGPGNVWSGGRDASFGDFSATDLTQFLAVQDSFDQKIANVSRIPTHWLNMGGKEFPSGESLKTAEAPYVTKLRGLGVAMGNTHEDATSFGLKTIGKKDIDIDSSWASFELRSENDLAQVAVLRKQYGYSNEFLQAADGLTPDQIEQMKQENADAVAEAQANMAAGFGSGLAPGGGNEDEGPPPAGSEAERR